MDHIQILALMYLVSTVFHKRPIVGNSVSRQNDACEEINIAVTNSKFGACKATIIALVW